MKKFLFSVCAVLAFFGCGGDTNDLPPFPFGPEEYYYYSSSSNWGFVPSSSSYGGFNGGGYNGSYGSVAYGGRTYRTVRIGSQTWMAENLNYDPGTGNSACYDGKTSYCATYGRLYDWSTANTVCRKGWHLPDDDEWATLVNAAGGSSRAGKHLKSKTGWNSDGGVENRDTHGFSALPGGLGDSDGGFYDVGYYGYWWSATEINASRAHTLLMPYDFDYVVRDLVYGYGLDDVLDFTDKSNLYSVRCVHD